MTSDTYQAELETAVRAVLQAARLCRTVQSHLSPDVIKKKDRSPVTVADFGSQALVCRTITERFPHDAIVAEEDATVLALPENQPVRDSVVDLVGHFTGEATVEAVCAWINRGNADGSTQRFWTLDPIDGTKGFLRGGQYAVALALIEDGELKVGALACPNLSGKPLLDGQKGLIYAAVRGEGTRVISMDHNAIFAEVAVSGTHVPSAARFCESVESGHSSHGDAAAVASLLGIQSEPVRLDSQAKYAMVARGEADIYMRLPTRPGYVERIWDHAAGALVIEESGGTVTDVLGKPLAFVHGKGLAENHGVVATNGLLHHDVMEALASVGVGRQEP